MFINRRLFLSVGVVCLVVTTVYACKCKTQTPLESFCQADWVSHLRVKLRVTKQPMPSNPLRKGLTNIKYFVNHIHIYKVPKEFDNSTLPIEIFTPAEAPACGLVLEAGKEYLLAGRATNGTLTTVLCGQVLLDQSNATTFENVLEWSMVDEKLQKWLDLDKSKQCE